MVCGGVVVVVAAVAAESCRHEEESLACKVIWDERDVRKEGEALKYEKGKCTEAESKERDCSGEGESGRGARRVRSGN